MNSTCVAGAIANRLGLTWETKDGVHKSNYWGSVMMSSTVKLGNDTSSRGGSSGIYTPLHNMLPMVHPNDIVWGGWDISSSHLGDCMRRSQVLDLDLQNQLYPHLSQIKPMKSCYFPDFIAANQIDRADNVLDGSKKQQMEQLRQDIRDFKSNNHLDQVVVVWTANTERFACIEEGINDTGANLLASIDRDETEISASTVFACAAVLEECTAFINGSPQNTFVPGYVILVSAWLTDDTCLLFGLYYAIAAFSCH